MATYQNLNSVATTSAELTDADKIPLIQSNNLKLCTLDKLVKMAQEKTLDAFQAQYLDLLTEGCFFVTAKTRITTGAKYVDYTLYPASKYSSIPAEEEKIGISVSSGEHGLVVALANVGAAMPWATDSTTMVTGEIVKGQDFWSDWDGKGKTEKILAKLSTDGDTQNAAKYCATYSTTNVPAGNWWLPSSAELILITNNAHKINALRKIAGVNELIGYFGSSTEYESPSVIIASALTNTGKRVILYYMKTNSAGYKVNVIPVTSVTISGIWQAKD